MKKFAPVPGGGVSVTDCVHSSSDRFLEQFEELKMRLGMDSYGG